MNELKHDHQSQGDPNDGPIHHGQPPYWRRAHRDWRIWFCEMVMFDYLATGDLRWRLQGQSPQSPQPISTPAGN